MGFKLIDGLVAFLTVPLAILVVLGISASFVPPSFFLVPSFLALGLPVLFGLLIGTTVYWALRWRRWFWLCSFVLIGSFWVLPSIWAFQIPVEGKSSPIIQPNSTEINLVTYNVHGSYGLAESKEVQVQAQGKLIQKAPQIIAFQEFRSSLKSAVLLEAYPHHVHEAQLAIFSQWPITNHGYHRFPGDYNYGGNAYLWADVKSPAGVVRVYNFHLASIQLGSSNYDLPEQWSDLSDPDELELRGRRYFPLLAKGFVFRQQQQAELMSHIQSTSFPVLLCGDLNDVPGSFAYWKFARTYPDAFRQSGRGGGRTYHSALIPLRIDYVFNGTPWTPMHAEVLHLDGSDHDPLWVQFSASH